MLRHGIFILAALSLSLAFKNDPPDSPCPTSFRYAYSPSQGWHGVISYVPPLKFSKVNVVVRLAVVQYLRHLPVGKIEVLGGSTEIQNIANRATLNQIQVIQFLVVFPPYDEFPLISSVKINQVEQCVGQAFKGVNGYIDLSHNLNVQLPPPVTTEEPPSPPTPSPPTPSPPTPSPPAPSVLIDTRNGAGVPQASRRQAQSTRMTPSTITSNKHDVRNDDDDDEYRDYPDYPDDSHQYEVNRDECGPLPGRTSQSQSNELVISGEKTKRGDWPWMAALFTTADNAFRCGGSLISRRHVITAAHCLTESSRGRAMSPSSLIIYLGRYDLFVEERGTQEIEIDKISINSRYYSSRKQDFDIGVLLLATPAHMTKFVKPVCLWDDTLGMALPRSIGMAPGWGKDEDGSSGRDMKLARMPVVSENTCVSSDPDFFRRIVSGKTFCAGYANGTTLCNGDSGGGLFFSETNPKTRKTAWFVRGIVSLSKKNEYNECGEFNYVVFTDIRKVLIWLKPRLQPPMESK